MGSTQFLCIIIIIYLIAATAAQNDPTAEDIKKLKKKLKNAGALTAGFKSLCNGPLGASFKVTDVVGVPADAPKEFQASVKFGGRKNHVAEIHLKKAPNGEIVGARTSSILLTESYWLCQGGEAWSPNQVAAFEDAVAFAANR